MISSARRSSYRQRELCLRERREERKEDARWNKEKRWDHSSEMLQLQLIVMGYNTISIAGWEKSPPLCPQDSSHKEISVPVPDGREWSAETHPGNPWKCPGLTCDSTPECFAPSFKSNPKCSLFQQVAVLLSLCTPAFWEYFLFNNKSSACLPLFTTSCSYILECLPVMTLTCSPMTHLLG